MYYIMNLPANVIRAPATMHTGPSTREFPVKAIRAAQWSGSSFSPQPRYDAAGKSKIKIKNHTPKIKKIITFILSHKPNLHALERQTLSPNLESCFALRRTAKKLLILNLKTSFFNNHNNYTYTKVYLCMCECLLYLRVIITEPIWLKIF